MEQAHRSAEPRPPSPHEESLPSPIDKTAAAQAQPTTTPASGVKSLAEGLVANTVASENPDNFRASLFASKTEFSWWFPKITDDEKLASRIWKSKRSRALLLQISVIAAILITNLGLTMFAVTRYESQNGVGVIYEGDCTTVGNLDQWLHLLINLLGTGMLSASNYCMQLQAAPTRADVDRAHAKNRWLDIGVSSFRNLGSIGKWRRFSWALLAFSSVPIHLMSVSPQLCCHV